MTWTVRNAGDPNRASFLSMPMRCHFDGDVFAIDVHGVHAGRLTNVGNQLLPGQQSPTLKFTR
jgi:hypothetical protein